MLKGLKLFCFSPTFLSLRNKLSQKTIFLVKSKVVRLSLNTSTADDKYSCHSRENFPQQIRMQLFKNQKRFVKILLRFWNRHNILNILKKNMNLSMSEIICSKRRGYLNVLKILFQKTL